MKKFVTFIFAAMFISTYPVVAETSGKRTCPPRAVIIAKEDAGLLLNDRVYQLGEPQEIQDVSWIKPGKAAGDWYNANNVYGVDFRAGINTDTYKYFIEFSSSYNLECIIFGKGWYVAAMTDWKSREFEVDLPFLEKKPYRVDIYQDGINADRYGSDYKRVKMDVTQKDTLKIKSAPGGGYAAL